MYRISYTLQTMVLTILPAPVVGRKESGVKISLSLINRGTDLGSTGQINKKNSAKEDLKRPTS